jgi:uncharacterized repeat protein (TIGR03803 family)
MTGRLNVRWLRSFVGVVVGLGTILIPAHVVRAQVAYERLYGFAIEQIGSTISCPDGTSLLGGVIQASDGNFYGTTSSCGAAGGGTVFRITADGTFITLHSFSFECCDGAEPTAGLIQASDGAFNGTTMSGGEAGAGKVFEHTDR